MKQLFPVNVLFKPDFVYEIVAKVYRSCSHWEIRLWAVVFSFSVFTVCSSNPAFAQHIRVPVLPDESGLSSRQSNTVNAQKIQQMANPTYRPPVGNNYSGGRNAYDKQTEDIAFLRKGEAMVDEQLNANKYMSADFLKQSQPFFDALNKLKSMLEGKENLSLASAYFISEDVWGDNYLTEKEYQAEIAKSADYIKKWLNQNGYDMNDNVALNTGIQKFMSGTLSVTSGNNNKDGSYALQTTTHQPFKYDYTDFAGEKDVRNFFVTKAFATGTGQCNSLPAVYMVLAEALHAKAYMSMAPQHAFIKYPINGSMQNYEATSNTYISDRWYEDNLFISPEAKRNNIFMDTVNTRQLIANCAIDMAMVYMRRFGVADGRFVLQAIELAQSQYVGKQNINAVFLLSSMYVRLLDDAAKRNNISSMADINKSPEVAALYNRLLQNEALITKLGYRPLPDGKYRELMSEHSLKDSLQTNSTTNPKQRRNMFWEIK